MFRKIKNNKLRNTGIIFLILVNNISILLLENNLSKKAMNVLKKIFKPDSEMVKLLKMYKALYNSKAKFLNEYLINKYIDIILLSRKSMINLSKLLRLKYIAVGILKLNYPDLKLFFKANVMNYKKYSSIYMLILSHLNTQIYDPVLQINTRKLVILNFLEQKNNNTLAAIEVLTEQPKEILLKANLIIINEYNKKYLNLLSEQKSLLKLYIVLGKNNKLFTKKFKTLTLLSCKRILNNLNLNKSDLHLLDYKKIINTVLIIQEKIMNYTFINLNNVKMLMNLYNLELKVKKS